MKNNDAIEDTEKLVESKSSKRLVRRNIHRRNSSNPNVISEDSNNNTKEKTRETESPTKGKIALFEEKSIGRRNSHHQTVSSSKY
jgi:hypothetical protein